MQLTEGRVYAVKFLPIKKIEMKKFYCIKPCVSRLYFLKVFLRWGALDF